MTGVTSSNFLSPTNLNQQTSRNSQTLMKDDFLKLLIVQLKNQDPLSPVDDSQFLAQMAQFSALEQMTNIAESVQELNHNLTWLSSQSLLTQGAAMIGKEAKGLDDQGNEVSGLITSVRWHGYTLQVQIGENLLKLENLTEVRESSANPVVPNPSPSPETVNNQEDSSGTAELEDNNDS